MPVNNVKKSGFYRLKEGAFVGGVCAGFADQYDLDAIVVRILAILFFIMTCGILGIVYIILWAYFPIKSQRHIPFDITPESAESSAYGSVEYSYSSDELNKSSIPPIARLAVAVGLVILFLLVATWLCPLVPGAQWWQFWPLAFLMVGLCFIIIPIHIPFEVVWHVAGIILASISAWIIPMSLGILSWYTIDYSLENLWLLLLIAILIFAFGAHQQSSALVIGSAICILLFCLASILFFSIPGEVETFLFMVPNQDIIYLGF